MNKKLLGLAVTTALAAIAGYAEAVSPRIGGPIIETIFRGFLKGPLTTGVQSRSNAFSGLTTLASGSATVTVSTVSVGSDSIIEPHIRSARPAAYTSVGALSVAAGAASAVASTTAVFSGQQIDLMYQSLVNQASGQCRGFRVNSIVDGISFQVMTEDGQNVTSGPANVNWRIPETVPMGLTVNTISPGNFFTLGWADGKPRPIDSTIMWELRKGS